MIGLTPIDNNGPSQSQMSVLTLAAKATMPQREQLEAAAQLMAGRMDENIFVVGGDKSGWSGFVTVEDHPKIPGFDWLWSAYEAAFTAANLVREGFLGAIQSEEIDQKLYDFNRDLIARYHGPIEFAIKCKLSGYRSMTLKMESIDVLLDRASQNCSDEVDALLFAVNAPSIVGQLSEQLERNGLKYLSVHCFVHPSR